MSGDPAEQRLTREQIARVLGLSPSYISRLTSDGVLEREPDELYVLGPTVRAYQALHKAPADATEALTALRHHQAEVQRLKALELRRESVPTVEVVGFASELVFLAVNALAQLPARVATGANLAAEVDRTRHELAASLSAFLRDYHAEDLERSPPPVTLGEKIPPRLPAKPKPNGDTAQLALL